MAPELRGRTERNQTAVIEQLESLVEELLKDVPEEAVIAQKMKALNLEYSEDPVERINRVLEALHPYALGDIEL